MLVYYALVYLKDNIFLIVELANYVLYLFYGVKSVIELAPASSSFLFFFCIFELETAALSASDDVRRVSLTSSVSKLKNVTSTGFSAKDCLCKGRFFLTD